MITDTSGEREAEGGTDLSKSDTSRRLPSTRRILVVGINYGPEVSGIAPYTADTARSFAAAGWDVTVLTGVPHYPEWTVPSGYRRRVVTRERDGLVRVIRVRHFVPRRQSAVRRGLYELTFALGVAVVARALTPDRVLAVSPSLLSSWVAARVARKRGARFVLWVQDSMAAATEESGIPGASAVTRVTSHIEKAVSQAADDVVLVSPGFQERFLSYGVDPSKVHVQLNWTHISDLPRDRPEARRELGWADDEFVVVHSGNVGYKQALENLVEAAEICHRARPDHLRFVIFGTGSRLSEVVAIAGQKRVPIDFRPFVDSSAYPSVLEAADLLVVNESSGVSTMSLPSKVTSYLSAASPVVAAVPANGATALLLEDAKAAIVVPPESPVALAEAIIALSNDPAKRAELGRNGQAYARRAFDRDRALRAIAQILVGAA